MTHFTTNLAYSRADKFAYDPWRDEHYTHP